MTVIEGSKSFAQAESALPNGVAVMHANSDFVSSHQDERFVVAGFFTPNYLDYARGFVGNLEQHGIPYHLYAIGDSEWNAATRYKPSCIQRCRSDYPTRTIVSMDIDCRVKGPIFESLNVPSDVGLRYAGRFRARRSSCFPSTRVTVWNPTVGAAALLSHWRHLCATAPKAHNDEALLMRAISETVGASISAFDPRYAGIEANSIWSSDGDVIVHESIHNKERSTLKKLKHGLRDLRHKAFTCVTGRAYADWKYGD